VGKDDAHVKQLVNRGPEILSGERNSKSFVCRIDWEILWSDRKQGHIFQYGPSSEKDNKLTCER
jgi:hypothetical protein